MKKLTLKISLLKDKTRLSQKKRRSYAILVTFSIFFFFMKLKKLRIMNMSKPQKITHISYLTHPIYPPLAFYVKEIFENVGVGVCKICLNF